MGTFALPAWRRGRSERGQGAVELALVLALLLTLLLGALDMGRAFYAYMAITNAAREGARAGVFAGSPTGLEDVVLNAITDAGLDAARAAVTYSWGGSNQPLWVGVQYPHDLIVGTFLPVSQITLVSSASMLIP